jgi:Peptidase family M1 domain
MKLRLSLLVTLMVAQFASAQMNPAVFAPMDWPTPNSYRTADGRPGQNYWQQRADYDIKASLDTAASRVTGTETITYTNNSPKDLSHLWLQLDQNLFKEGSRGNYEYDSPRIRWRGAFRNGGDELSSVVVIQNGVKEQAHFIINDTRMLIDLGKPLPAQGGKVQLEISWSFVVPRYGSDRMGRFESNDGTVYEVAQWYPRMYVYDDVRGWNPLPYLGEGEFYLEYGDFNVEITAPHDYIVVGTGVLQNPKEVLTRTERERLVEARTTDKTVHVISRDEVGDRDTRPAGHGDLTWKFHADSVRDFSWAASKSFIWDASHWDNILLMAVYPKEGIPTDTASANPGWESVVQMMRHTFKYYSTNYFHYPYPVAVNVAGIVGGMEYPMIVFCSVHARGQSLYSVTDHEFGHSWFPMVVGSDERRHAWMDEGFNTFINYYSNRDFYGDSAVQNRSMQADTIAKWMQTSWNDQPIDTRADQVLPSNLGFLEYRKPGFGLRLLREFIIGPDRFDPAFKAYIRRWAFKHPQPSDFFRTIEDYTGEDLSWFWRGWFCSTHVLDQSIDSVVADSPVTVVYISNDRGLVMPTELQVTFADGDTSNYKLPVEIWFNGERYRFPVYDERKVVKVVLDPSHELPDVQRSNNVWTLPGESKK